MRKVLVSALLVIGATLGCATRAPEAVALADHAKHPTLSCGDGSFECGHECCSKGWRCCTDSNGNQYCGNNNCPN